MATNNSINTGNPIDVSKGGTGVSSNTAYAVLCGGTTGTGTIQSIASVGTSGQVLTSNGAGALPTFQDAGGGGIVLQQTRTILTTSFLTSSSIPIDNTIPQNTEGDELMTLSITPQSATSVLMIEATINGYIYYASTSIRDVTPSLALFKDSTANALHAITLSKAWMGKDNGTPLYLFYYPISNNYRYYETSGSTTARTYKIRVGTNYGTLYINNSLYGGVEGCIMTITEYSS